MLQLLQWSTNRSRNCISFPFKIKCLNYKLAAILTGHIISNCRTIHLIVEVTMATACKTNITNVHIYLMDIHKLSYDDHYKLDNVF